MCRMYCVCSGSSVAGEDLAMLHPDGLGGRLPVQRDVKAVTVSSRRELLDRPLQHWTDSCLMGTGVAGTPMARAPTGTGTYAAVRSRGHG